jgi:hypothetical protein
MQARAIYAGIEVMSIVMLPAERPDRMDRAGTRL